MIKRPRLPVPHLSVPRLPVPRLSIWPVLPLLLLAGCQDQLDPVADTFAPDYGQLFDEGPIPDQGGELPPTPDTANAVETSCQIVWDQTRPTGGVPSHPAVEPDGITTVAAGSKLYRYGADGQDKTVCAAPFEAKSESFGTPSIDPDGTAYVGTRSGKLYAITRKCIPKTKWTQPVQIGGADGEACLLNPDNPVLCDGQAPAIMEAPALSDKHVWVLDERPTLHKVTPDGNYLANFVSTDAPLPGAAPVFVDAGDRRFVAFPTRHTVVALIETAAKFFEFSEFLDSTPAREVTTPLAVTKDGKILFMGGTRAGNGHTDIALYRLTTEPQSKKAVVDDGFPKAISLPLDTIFGIVVGPDESIYAATQSHGLVKFDADGNEQWRFIGDAVSLRLRTVPALANNAVFITAQPHFVYGIDLDGNPIFERVLSGELETTSPAIRDDGTVIVHFGTQLMALRCDGTTGLANSGWPRYQRNNRNTGNSKVVK